jgi:general secretion pathway protein F
VPEFDYVSIDAAGNRRTGRLEAATRAEALRRLNDTGVFPVDVVPSGLRAPAQGTFDKRRSRPRPADITLFLRELGLLLQAGLKVDEGLATIAADTAAPRLQALASRLRAAINSGKTFSEAVAAEPGLFPAGVIGMIRAADATSRLRETLQQIADERERQERLRARIVSSLTYPALLIVTALIVVGVLLLVIVPQFRQGMADTGHVPSTRAMAMSDWLHANIWLTAGVMTALTGLSMAIILKTSVRRAMGNMALQLPVVGTLLRHALTARFCRTLSLLLSNGVLLPDALAYTREAIEHERTQRLIDQLIVNLRKGGELDAPLAAADIFPPIVTSMFRVGAESNSLSATSARLADMYEWKLETGMQRFVSVLEPSIIVVVSLIVGGVVLSIVQSIFGVYDLIGGPK